MRTFRLYARNLLGHHIALLTMVIMLYIASVVLMIPPSKVTTNLIYVSDFGGFLFLLFVSYST